MNVIEAGFRPLIGLPCWNVKPGYGSFLTLEFGEPHLEVLGPIAAPERSPRVRRLLARRRIVVHGEWHLWIYCCEWRVYTGERLVGDSALQSRSKRRIERGARELDGQKLIHVSVDPICGTSVFTFDLGSRLETAPYDAAKEQWLLYEPSGQVLSYRGDGSYRHCAGDTQQDEEVWTPVP